MVGNTVAHRFFKNAEILDFKTDLKIIKDLMKRLIIFTVLGSGYEINMDEFETFVFQSAELFISLYPWYYMPVTA